MLFRSDSKILGFYTHAILATGEHVFEWMPLHEVQAIRGRSQSGNSGPWATDFAEMGKKTVLRRAAKYLPRSIEFSDALAAEDRVEFDGEPPTVAHVEVRPPAPPATPATAARLPAPPPAVEEPAAEEFTPSPEVVPFEDDGFPL